MNGVMKTGSPAKKSGMTRGPRSLSLVLTLTLALLVSLAHCATCDVVFAGDGQVITSLDQAKSLDQGTSQPAPEKQVHACSGHCLSHVTGQAIVSMVIPADVVHSTLPIGREQSMTSIAGLALFKPPRA